MGATWAGGSSITGCVCRGERNTGKERMRRRVERKWGGYGRKVMREQTERSSVSNKKTTGERKHAKKRRLRKEMR